MEASRYEVLQWGEATLQAAGIGDWKTDAWLLYEYVTGMGRAAFLMESQAEMALEEEKTYHRLIGRRCEHEPLQHITGVQEFMGFEFMVNEHVLVPRMDTEVLVQEVERHVQDGHSVLDMCTGSGCIAISLKKRRESLSVTAVDISQHALKVAESNCKKLQAEVRLCQSDLFAAFEESGYFGQKDSQLSKQSQIYKQLPQFDIIVSNPPYIPSAVVEGLEPEVREHEPRLALDGAEDGLAFYRRITRDSRAFLKKGGMLFYEIGHDQGKEVHQIMKEAGFLGVTVVQDLAGLDRVVYGGIGNV